MLEAIFNPKRTDKGPFRMFFIGLVYASISLLLVKWFFGKDMVLSQYSGMIVVAFCVMFSLPFMYYLIRQEELKNETIEGFFGIWKVHRDAVFGFMWLFLGFIVAFSFWFMLIGDNNLFNAQIETYCAINSPSRIENCVNSYLLGDSITGGATKSGRLLSIFENNVLVMILTLIFSLVFGAGAIFVLAWNATVISAAIAIFTKNSIMQIPMGLGRYMIHGFPEIAAYFITALAGGMFGVGFIRHGIKSRRFLRVVGNVVIMLVVAVIILILAAIIEVYITPALF